MPIGINIFIFQKALNRNGDRFLKFTKSLLFGYCRYCAIKRLHIKYKRFRKSSTASTNDNNNNVVS